MPSDAEKEFWSSPPLSPEDQALIDAYVRIIPLGTTSVERLAYTEDFDQLIKTLGRPDTLGEKHHVYQRLLYLQRTGRLPYPLRSLQKQR